MNEEEKKLAEEAVRWIKSNSNFVIEKFVAQKRYEAGTQPVSLFMAGSPGAGKTEVSRRLAQEFSSQPVLIDADEIRKICPGYAGANAHIFQGAATKGVHILYDHVLAKNLNMIMDGTFAYAEAVKNIERSVRRGRKVELDFVYQDPLLAWDFTKKREALESRRVSKEVFINAFFKARENANKAKEQFGKDLQLNLVIKNVSHEIERFELNIEKIDYYIKQDYTESDLNKMIL